MAILVLLQKDLRLIDNPALFYAVQTSSPVIVAYIPEKQMGAANLWWVNKSLKLFKENLAKYKIPLLYADKIFDNFFVEINKLVNISAIYSNGLDFSVSENLTKIHKLFSGNFLFDHTKIEKEYKVFTPFWKYLCKTQQPQEPLAIPSFTKKNQVDTDLSKFENFPYLTGHNWWDKFEPYWQVGEIGAHKALETFKEHALENYGHGRNIPAEKYTSRLSPHIRFGEISVRYICDNLRSNFALEGMVANRFMTELGWREFAYHTSQFHADIKEKPLNIKYANFYPDHINRDMFENWKKGQTGFPIVDAGMRELWETGWMHNRVRMICASFLTKNLLIPWQMGEEWFFDCLVDGDPAVNPFSWQWVAGCGVDSAPYFRIFNPILQGKTHDAKGDYVKKWIPELQNYSPQFIHEPHLAAPSLFDEKYVTPIIDLKKTRDRALQLYKNL